MRHWNGDFKVFLPGDTAGAGAQAFWLSRPMLFSSAISAMGAAVMWMLWEKEKTKGIYEIKIHEWSATWHLIMLYL